MNKKTLIAAPLAVLAMGFTSCNNSWSTITFEEAKTIAENIKKEIEKSDYVTHGKTTYECTSATKLSNLIIYGYNLTNSYDFNYTDAYSYLSRNREAINTKGKVTTEIKERSFFNDNKYAEVNELQKTFIYDSEESKDDFLKELKDNYNFYSGLDFAADYIDNLDETKTSFDAIVAKVNKDKNEYASYSFNSDNKEKNLEITFKAKISDYTGTIIEDIFDYMEFYLSEYKTLEYAQVDVDIKFEDYKITYCKCGVNSKGIDETTEKELEYSATDIYSTNYSDVVANYNLDNYIDITEK